jgi:hypothetical protein
MRPLPAIKWAAGILLFLNAVACFGQPTPDGINTCVIDGVTYTNILDVHADASGGIIIMHKAGAIRAYRGDLSSDFLKSWGISPSWISPSWISNLETGISPNPFPYDCTNCSKQSTALVQMLSPKVREFIEHHSEVNELLTDAFREATTNRTMRVYYFYTEDVTVPPAFHSWTFSASNFVIFVRENDWPVDELTGIFFELINSQRDDKVQAIVQRAALGRIGRQDYVVAIAKEEFAAAPKLQAFLNRLRLSKQEMAECRDYQFFAGAPMDFETFMSHMKEASLKGRNYFGFYEEQYDAIRPQASSAEPANTIRGWPSAEGINTCVIGGVTYTKILCVRADSSGGIVIMHKAGAIKVQRSDLSSDFLKSWGISASSDSSPAIAISTNQDSFDSANNGRQRIAPLVQMFSPKVREFIEHHDEVNRPLTDIFTNMSWRATSIRNIRVYYFYTEDVAAAPAYYYMDGRDHLVIAVSESQKPVDELIEIVFEMIDSEREHKWQEIWQQATQGRIGRKDFADAMVKEEFAAYPKTRAFVNRLRLNKQEMAESVYFQHFAEAPEDLGAFMSYMKEASSKGRDAFKEFEAKYDALQAHASPAAPGTGP